MQINTSKSVEAIRGHIISVYVASELHQQVQQAAAALGVKTGLWLRQMIRQVTSEDFSAS